MRFLLPVLMIVAYTSASGSFWPERLARQCDAIEGTDKDRTGRNLTGGSFGGRPSLLAVATQEPAPAKLSISGSDKWEPYRIVRLRAVGTPEKAGRLWKIKPLDDPTARVDWATGRNVEKVEWVAPPGRYLVTLSAGWLGADGAFQLDEAELEVTVGVPPPPPPGPGPGPAPTPIPSGEFRVILLREVGAALPTWTQHADVIKYLDEKAKEWRVYDPQQVLADSESPKMREFFEKAKPQYKLEQLPLFLLIKGDVGQLEPVPKDKAAGMALLRKYGG